jgi:hypothetical protein
LSIYLHHCTRGTSFDVSKALEPKSQQRDGGKVSYEKFSHDEANCIFQSNAAICYQRTRTWLSNLGEGNKLCPDSRADEEEKGSLAGEKLLLRKKYFKSRYRERGNQIKFLVLMHGFYFYLLLLSSNG